MAHTVFTGKGQTFSADAHVQSAIKRVTVDEAAKPPVARLDKTIATSAAYEQMDDPMGPKGDPHATVTVLEDDSTIGFAETQGHHLTLGGAAVAVVAAASATPGDNKYSHSMRLTRRVTRCPHDALATVELTFEALTHGTWGTV